MKRKKFPLPEDEKIWSNYKRFENAKKFLANYFSQNPLSNTNIEKFLKYLESRKQEFFFANLEEYQTAINNSNYVAAFLLICDELFMIVESSIQLAFEIKQRKIAQWSINTARKKASPIYPFFVESAQIMKNYAPSKDAPLPITADDLKTVKELIDRAIEGHIYEMQQYVGTLLDMPLFKESARKKKAESVSAFFENELSALLLKTNIKKIHIAGIVHTFLLSIYASGTVPTVATIQQRLSRLKK